MSTFPTFAGVYALAYMLEMLTPNWNLLRETRYVIQICNFLKSIILLRTKTSHFVYIQVGSENRISVISILLYCIWFCIRDGWITQWMNNIILLLERNYECWCWYLPSNRDIIQSASYSQYKTLIFSLK